MSITKLLEGYYEGTLSDAEEEQLELLMRAGHPEIPEQDRKMYLALANLPVQNTARHNKSTLVWRIASAAAAIALVVGLGFYTYNEQQKERATEQEILEMAMGNVSMALHESDSSRVKVAGILKSIKNDTTMHKSINTKTKNI